MYATIRKMGLRRRLLGLLILALLVSVPASARERTDVVVMNNGDRITGEIRQLERGILTLKTDDLGTIDIDWVKVETLTSRFVFEVVLESGAKFFGSLPEQVVPGTVVVEAAVGSYSLVLPSVVSITPIHSGFFKRLKGSLGLGYSFYQANSLATLSLAGEVNYRTRKYLRSLRVDSYYSNQDNVENTSRNSATFNFTRYFTGKNFLVTYASLEQNNELGLDYRLLAGPSFGRHFVNTNRTTFGLLGGLMLGRERYSVSTGGGIAPVDSGAMDSEGYNLEGLAGASYEVFKFDTPKLDSTSTLLIFPSFTDWGRVRINFDTRVRYELIKDFYLVLSFFDHYDSRPPVEGLVKNDYGMSFAISWEFK